MECSGCGILVCSNLETYDRIIEADHRVYDRMIECHEYRRGNKLKVYNQELWDKRVFVRNVPSFFTSIQLKNIFEVKIGPVAISSVNNSQNSQISGFVSGFITFDSEEDAEKAIKVRFISVGGDHVDLFVERCISAKGLGINKPKEAYNDYQQTKTNQVINHAATNLNGTPKTIHNNPEELNNQRGPLLLSLQPQLEQLSRSDLNKPRRLFKTYSPGME
jgi:hypothetical protein